MSKQSRLGKFARPAVSVPDKNVDTWSRMVNFDATWINMQHLATEKAD